MIKRISNKLSKIVFIFKGRRRNRGLKRIRFFGHKHISLGTNNTFGRNCRFECYDDYFGQKLEGKITFGNNCVIMNDVTILSALSVSIGDNCLIASSVFITDENHGIDPFGSGPYIKQPLTCSKVNIGNNVWIGEKAVILPGVSIGNNSIVGAGSIVTKDIPDLCIAVGNPARVIKRFNKLLNKWISVKNI